MADDMAIRDLDDEGDARPLVVTMLGVLYLAQAGRYLLLSGVFGARPALGADWFTAFTTGGMLLLPAAPLLLVGIGFVAFRSPWVYYGAMLIAVLALGVILVGGIVDVVEVVGKMTTEDPYAETVGVVVLLRTLLAAIVALAACVIHVLVLAERRVTRWFR